MNKKSDAQPMSIGGAEGYCHANFSTDPALMAKTAYLRPQLCHYDDSLMAALS